MHVSVDDDEDADIAQYFERTCAFIHAGSTLVHCFAGISLSPTIVMAYLIRQHKFTVDQALEHCTFRRPCVQPNPGFMRALMQEQLDQKVID
jgi:protein-tyrosine phosphatase